MKWGFKKTEKQSGLNSDLISDAQIHSGYYEDPCQITSGPKGNFEGGWEFDVSKLLYNSGPGGFSIAVGACRSDSSQANGRMIAMRWNGAHDNNRDTGFPKTSAGGGNWFPIPRDFFTLVATRTDELIQADRIVERLKDTCQN